MKAKTQTTIKPGSHLILAGSAPTVVGDIERAHYVVTDEQLRALARAYMQGEQYLDAVRGSYLRILLSAVQHETARQKVKRLTEGAALKMIEECHDRLYTVVLDAVTTEDVANVPGLDSDERRRRALERNRRSNFARSAKSTLVRWIEHGGKVGALEAEKVTKRGLTVEGEREGVGVEEMIMRVESTARVLAARVEELRDLDRDAAERAVEAVRIQLGLLVARQVTGERRTVGDITLHPHH